ncbi:MAG: CotH kinase family protein [Deltaproteobacteria bacterium]|nr:CotH kinase family protein [Deltaproteobacteria bacterium]
MIPLLLLFACAAPEGALPPDPREVEEVLGPKATLVLNEVMPDNESTVMDEAFGFPDWVELWNASREPVDLARVRLGSEDDLWEGGAGTLGPGGHLLLWADGRDLPFRIDKDGDTLVLYLDGAPVDRIATGPVPGDVAWARFPDGGAWQPTIRPTPGWTNGTRPPASLDPSDTLFQTEEITAFDLLIPAESWSSLSQDPSTEVPASLGFGAAWFGDVHVRIKGHWGSLRTLDQKAAFKVDLDDFDHRLRGQESLTFNNMVQDPTYLHEYLAYEVYRAAGIPTPRVGWTRLAVNGVDFGLYLLVESVDDVFLERWYADPSGDLYEGEYGVDFEQGYEGSFEYDEGDNPHDRSAITQVADALDQPADDAGIARLGTLVDLDEFILNQAIETLVLHWDGYTTQNNYRVYHDPATGRFQILPWGTDQTFISTFDPWYGYGLVFTYCLENTACAARYERALLEVADLVESLDLVAAMGEPWALLAADVESDPRREFDLHTVMAYLEYTRSNLTTWPDTVRAYVGVR